MVPAEHEIVAVIAFAQPVGLDLLRSVVPYETLEALEADGLIEHVVSGWRHVVRLADRTEPVAPPDRMSLCQLRLRRGVALALVDTGLRRAGDHFALGRFQLDGILKPDPEVLSRAARYAIDHDHPVAAVQLAGAAARTGGGFTARVLLAEASGGTGQAEAAEDAFAGLVPSTEDEIVRLAVARARNLFHGLGRTAAARRVLAIARAMAGPSSRLTAVEAEIDGQCAPRSLAADPHADPLVRAEVALGQGKVRTADQYFRQTWLGTRARPRVLRCLGGLAEIAALTDHPDEIESLRAQVAANQVEGSAIPAVELIPAWLLAATHDFAAARRVALDTAHRSTGAVAVTALYLACRLGAAVAAADGLAELAGTDPLFRAYASHAAALATRDLDGVQRVAATFAGFGANLLAAEALAWVGAEHQRCGRVGTAAALAHRAEEYLAACEGARSPCLRLAELAGLPRLTARESEVTGLAVAGLSNVDIAVRLVVSVRTVETHLSRIYHKLGVAGRPGLASALGTPPRPARPAASLSRTAS